MLQGIQDCRLPMREMESRAKVALRHVFKEDMGCFPGWGMVDVTWPADTILVSQFSP